MSGILEDEKESVNGDSSTYSEEVNKKDNNHTSIDPMVQNKNSSIFGQSSMEIEGQNKIRMPYFTQIIKESKNQSEIQQNNSSQNKHKMSNLMQKFFE